MLKKHPTGQVRIDALRPFIQATRQEEDTWQQAQRAEAMEFEHISLLHRMMLQIQEPKLNAVLGDAVSRLVSELWRLRRYEEVVATIDGFRESHPAHFIDRSDVGGGRVSGRDKALLNKRDDAVRQIEGRV